MVTRFYRTNLTLSTSQLFLACMRSLRSMRHCHSLSQATSPFRFAWMPAVPHATGQTLQLPPCWLSKFYQVLSSSIIYHHLQFNSFCLHALGLNKGAGFVVGVFPKVFGSGSAFKCYLLCARALFLFVSPCVGEASSFANFGCVSVCAVCKCACFARRLIIVFIPPPVFIINFVI